MRCRPVLRPMLNSPRHEVPADAEPAVLRMPAGDRLSPCDQRDVQAKTTRVVVVQPRTMDRRS